MNIRLVQESDLPELTNLFHQTVLAIAPQQYTPAQTQTWASFAADTDHFRQFIMMPTTYLAIDDTGILGFAGLSSNGHISSVYVRYDCIHQGVGSTLMQVILEKATLDNIQRLYAEASEFSLGLFKKFGFHLYDIEVVDRQGVEFKRYLVERTL